MSPKLNRMLTLLLPLTLIALWAATTPAQTSRGTVTGTVTDQNGAVVSGAEVELKNAATNQMRTTKTNDTGLYRLDAVDLAVYDLTIKAKGFRTVTNTGLEIQANRATNIDVQLEVGTAEIVVAVSASTFELLQKTDPVRGGNFTPRQLLNLPNSTLNPYELARGLPGVTTATAGAQFGTASQFSINGSRPRGNNYLIDGVENNDISVTGPAYHINNEDAVAEVSIQTGLFSAEFGRAGGGVFNLITKSGTNDIHGTMRWLHLSQRFNALTNGQRLAGLTKPPVFTENIFGGSVGGPLPLPRFGEGGPAVTSGRDRTFFFFSIQWDRSRSTFNFGNFRVPTINGVAQLQALFPPGTNANLDLYLRAIGTTRGVTSRNTIGLGQNETAPFIETGLVGVPFPRIFNARQWVARIDHRVNEKHQLAFRYTIDTRLDGPLALFVSPGFRIESKFNDRNFLATDTWIVSSSLTMELRASYGKIDFQFPISPDADPLAFTQPSIAINGLATVGTPTNIPQFRVATNYLLQDTATKVYNSHTFRFGLEFLKQVADQSTAPFNSRGAFGFGPSTSPNFTGLANFLANFSGQGTANINIGSPVYHPNLFRQSYFIQDTWKTTPNLTLTLGLRYENFGQPANTAFRFPAFAGFDPASFNVPNKVERDNNNFGPIVGFAYSPQVKSGPFHWLFGEGKSSIRGGYQVSFDTFFNNMLSNIGADSPNNFNITTTPPLSGRGLANFFPGALPTTTPAVTPLLQQTSVFNPKIRNPYTQRWSLGIQRELPLDLIMDLSYVGSAGRKLFVTEDLNPINPATGQRFVPTFGVRRYRTSGANSNYHSMQLRVDKRFAKGFQANSSYTWSKLMDQLSEIYITDQNGSNLSVVPAFQGGLKRDYAPSDYHRKHRFTAGLIWDLPGPQSGFLGQVVGGWRIAGVFVLQSGAPFTLLNGVDRNGDGVIQDRPDLGNPNAPHNTRARVISTAICATGLRNPDNLQCVTRNDVYVVQVGPNTGFPGPAMLGRNTERSNPVQNVDMSLFKIFRVKENLRLEYRLDAYNLFNHPQFTGIPGKSVGTGTAAGDFLNYDQITGGGRDMRMGLKIIF